MTFPILIAEDNEDEIILFRIALERARLGCTFHFVRDGEEAIEWIQGVGIRADRTKFPIPSVVITDIKMPKKNGFELLEWIRSQPKLSGLPVIVYSSSGDAGDVARAFSLGATTYFSKGLAYLEIIKYLKSMPTSAIEASSLDATNFKPILNQL